MRVLKISLFTVLVGALLLVGVGWLDLHTYRRFAGEIPVAALTFEQLGERRYQVSFESPGRGVRTLLLDGDEWQLDVRMIKWKDWLTFLGEDPVYRLDRLSGRYKAIGDARAAQPSVHALGDESAVDVWAFARRADDWLPGVDAAYGSSVFVPMGDGFRYEVTMSRTGLVARRLADRGEG